MARSPKLPLRLGPLMSLAMGSVDPHTPAVVTKPVKLDFAANPNHYRANGKGKIGKAKPPQGPRVNLSPRLELGLSVECDTNRGHDPEFEE
jgi:hypothetical protein